ncbi:MAG: nickel pincer cofactor biosynthesis protein LarC [Dehalococcoidia bacterium]
MRIGYVDCFSGVSGDMLLGAIIDAGVPAEALREELARLPLDGYTLDARKVIRASIAATHVSVAVQGEPEPRTFREVAELIAGSRLPEADKDGGTRVFRGLAEAEAAVHGETIETLHLHDVGAVDAIVDVMGTVAGLRLLGVEAVFCSPLPAGEGEAHGPHGTLPVPAPATLELLRRANAPLRRADAVVGEAVTPTGAAIVTTLAHFERPEMTVERVGYGAGSRDPEGRPNVLRLWTGEGAAGATRPMVLIETNIDDMTPEMLGYALEKLLAEGAADAWFTPLQMKKNRPGVMLSAICSEADEEKIARLILRETSTLGVRVRPVSRWEAEREVIEFESSLGPAAAKVKRLPGEPPSIAPEYEACWRLAEASGMPIVDVYRVVEDEARAHIK